jgi:hypothetical protein
MGNGQKSRDNYEQINDVTSVRVTRIADYDKQWTSRMNVPKMGALSAHPTILSLKRINMKIAGEHNVLEPILEK